MHETFADADELIGAVGDEIGDVPAFAARMEEMVRFEFFFENLRGSNAAIAEGDVSVICLQGV